MGLFGKKISTLFTPHNALMALCCAAMVGAFFVFVGNGATTSLFSLLVPLIACLGMHVVMHKFMGKSCHGADGKEPTPGKSRLPESGAVKSLPDSAG